MFDELLRLAGVDLNARIAAWKAHAEDKAQHAVAHAKDEARIFAIKAGCFAAAGLMALLTFGALLLLLYRAIEEAYGPEKALIVVAMALCIAGVVMASVGAALGRSRSKQHILFDVPPPTARAPLPRYPLLVEAPTDSNRTLRELVAPLFSFVTRNAPLTGNWALDGVLRLVGGRTQATTVRAIEGAADIVRTGSRPTMLVVLGSAGLVGWLLLRRRR